MARSLGGCGEARQSPQPDPWEENPNPNQHTLKVINDVNSLYEQSKSDWLRLRAAYQMLRLYRYNHQPAQASKVYDVKIASSKSSSWITAAAMYEKAGATKGPEGDYFYSRAFDRNYRRTDCLIRFNSKDLDKILPYAKSSHERTVLYAMHAFNYPGKSLPKLKAIYAAEPEYKEFPFLLLREINKVEDWLMTSKVTDFHAATRQDQWDYDAQKTTAYYKEDIVYAKDLYAFVEQVVKENKNKQPALLNLYAAHLALVQEDYPTSLSYLEAAKKYKPTAQNIKTQLQVNELLLNTILHKKLEAADEKQLLHILQAPDKESGVHDPALLKDQLILFIAKKMISRGERAKGLLLLGKTQRVFGELIINSYKSVYQEMEEVATPADYDAIIALLDKKAKTPFEKFITSKIRNHPLDYYSEYEDPQRYLSEWNRNKVLDCKATWYIQHNNLEAALKTLKQIPDSFWRNEPYTSYIKGNPFFVNVYRAHRTNPQEGRDYTKTETIATMLQLEKMANANKAEAAQYYYEIANAWYNLSYYGKHWLMAKQYWSMYEVDDYNEELKKTPVNDNYYGCTRAKAYYLAALKATSDKKLAALCVFMAGKCDENYKRYNLMATSRKEFIPNGKNAYVSELVKKGFTDSYYKDLVNECLTYQDFIKAYNRQKR